MDIERTWFLSSKSVWSNGLSEDGNGAWKEPEATWTSSKILNIAQC